MHGTSLHIDIAGNFQKKFASIFKIVDKVEDKLGTGLSKATRKSDRGLNKLVGTARKLDSTLTSIPKRFANGMEKRIGKVGAGIAGAFAVSEVTSFFDTAIDKASDLTEATNKSNLIFGEQAKGILAWADNSAKALGIVKQEALANVSTVGNLFKNIGFDESTNSIMSKTIMQMSADLGSLHNLSTQDSFERLMAGLKGETEPLTKFGVILNETAIKQKALDMGLVKTTKGTLPQMAKTQAVFNILLEKSKVAQSDFANTSKDFATRMKIMQAQLQNQMTKIGQKVLPFATKIANKLSVILDWVNQNEEKVWSWVKALSTIGGAVIGLWALAKVILTVNTVVTGLAKGFQALRIGFGLLKVVLATNPFGWVLLVISGIVTLIATNKKLRNTVIGWLHEIPTYVGNFFSTIGGYISKFAGWVWKYHPFKFLFDLIDRVFPDFKYQIQDLLNGVKKAFAPLSKWIFNNVIKPVAKYWNVLAEVVGLKSWEFEIADVPKLGDVVKTKTSSGSIYDKASALSFGKSKGNASTPVSDKINGVSASGGGSIKTINIDIGKLVEKIEVHTTNMKMGTSKIKEEVTKVLLTAVNDVNYG